MSLVRRARSKYGAIKQTVDGITFDSKREAKRYCELKLLEKAKQLHRLTLQHPIVLLVHAKDAPAGYPLKKIGTYIADFAYCVCGTPDACAGAQGVVEDAKGFKTPLYRWKKKHVEAQYGIEIREV
jgi:hypothetical protein